MFEVDAVPATLAGARTRSAQLEAALARDPGAHRVLTGDRPTGPLHLGHFFGTLREPRAAAGPRRRPAGARRRLPDDHRPRQPGVAARATSRGSSPSTSRSGSTPARATIFAHSQVEALNQLLLPFLSLVSVAELARNPTVKDEMAAAGLAVDVRA